MRYRDYYFPFALNPNTADDTQQVNNSNLDIDPMDLYRYPENLSNAIALIQNTLIDEEEEYIFYTYMSEIAPSEEEMQMITGIRNDEISHHHLFSKIYQDITETKAIQLNINRFVRPASYCEGLKRALLAEQQGIENSRQILYAMQTRIHINMMTEILEDEIRHATLFNYMYTKNDCHL